MFSRISIMLVVTALLCSAAFTIGSRASVRQSDEGGIPPQHALALALHYSQELSLTTDELAKLTQMRDEMASEFAPLKKEAEAIQQRMRALQQSGHPDEATAKQLQSEGDAVGSKMQPLFERYATEVGNLLAPDQREKLLKLAEANAPKQEAQDFVLMELLQSRDQFDITPQQFTKLQYLQADFIRAFAPLREQMELLQIEVQKKFGKSEGGPPAEYRERGEAIQKQVAALQAAVSEHAVNDVLNQSQRTKLDAFLHGDHSSASSGG